MFELVRNIAAFIVALGILVAVHEWGHFWVARRCGVKVLRFSIGFGKALWRRTDKHGTEYVIAAIPLGGYVKMLDERVDEVPEAQLAMAFNRQPVLKKIAIVAAGPIVNFIFAAFALYLMFLIGVPTSKPMLGEIESDSIVARAGIPANSVITSVGGRQTLNWEEVNLELMSYIGKSAIPIGWKAAGSYSERFAVLDSSQWKFEPETSSALSSLGFSIYRPEILLILGQVLDNSAADLLGLRVGDKILRLDGTSMQNWEQIVGYVIQRPQQVISVDVERDGQELTLTGTVGQRETNGVNQGFMGFTPTLDKWPEGVLFTYQYGVIDSVSKALDKTWRLMTLSVEMLGKLISGDVSVKNLSGPIAIAQGAGMSASSGIVYFLSFLALISVNLGIINLLPLPVLDGGHLLYYFIELFSGRPVSESVQEIGFKIGGVILLLLMSIAIVNDITRL
ncbi:sigma E protease regulator RseP [Paraglaciecola hydrolytica]|uniref:Zinc metalloprotease n=1 Tax=Paraglaciecola hydrolytica TaxID=1799789 RepID=A0A148KMS1_9ALTE|nr:sigma E protease regulator RseP [Paraglaciecola hydrolytica]KXI27538.1 zinc metallopeptidase RseP [Paraglaciecola hydrolytica]